MKTCPSCGRENAEDASFCSACGTRLDAVAAREERKVVTCLFCDLVGFTAQAETMDPEDVRRMLQPYHARVRGELERFGGTVEKFIGDAVMAVFGAPVAHEDDPERAVRAALAIRDWADEEALELRIGVNTGEALVTIGSEPLAAGDVVNTAARLQVAAPTGGILVGEVTHRATRDAVEYREHAPVAAKGKAEPVPVWVAEQALARVKVEREARAPLVGVPGIGKSRLVYELFETVEQGPELVYWRHGRSLPYGDGVTFWALSEIVKAQAGILETDGPEQAGAKLETAVAAVAGDEDPRWLVRHLRPLVGLEADGGLDDRRTEAFAAWRQFLESLADHRPLVLVFEDLHWADDALLDFVDHLVDWASRIALLVLATARPELLERRPGWSGGKPNATTISLAPLSDDETAELVHALLESPVLPAETQTELLLRAGGNPLYAEEFARLVHEGRPPDDLPETVQGLIAARLDALDEHEKALLQAAAVVGKVFWVGAVSDVAEAPPELVHERMYGLERKEFVRRERRSSVAGETEYGFRHLLVRDVAYGQIPRGERAAKHQRAAAWIEGLGRPEDHAEMLAHHYLSALELSRAAGSHDESLVERAGVAAREAGHRALGLNAFPSAARLYLKAVELTTRDEVERPELLLRLGRALHLSADERAHEVLEEASRELLAAGDNGRAALAHELLSEVWWYRGKRDRSYEHLDRARDLLGSEESYARAYVLARMARTHMLADEHEEAIRDGREALAAAERLGLDDIRAHVLGTIGTARFQNGDPAGLKDVERGVRLARAAGSHQAGTALNNLGFMLFLAGDIGRDRGLRNESHRDAVRFGDERLIRFVRGCTPALDYYLGNWEDAAAHADAFIAECDAGSPHYIESNVRWTRAFMRLARGDEEGAISDAKRTEELARDSSDHQMLLPALAVRLRTETELGSDERARSLADELLEVAPRHAARPPAVELAWSADRLANTSRVRGWVEAIPYESRWTDAALAILDGELEVAAEGFAAIGSLPDEAFTRLRAAERLAADGRRAEADEQLQRSLAFYRSVGATRYVREGEALLAKTA